MIEEDDREYLERRVNEELHRAQTAADPGAVKAHYLMLGRYLDLLYGADEKAPHTQ